MICIVVWIDENLDSEENKKYIKELNSFGSLIVRLFKNLDKAIEYLKYIEFQETKIILSGEYIINLLKNLKKILLICVLLLKLFIN